MNGKEPEKLIRPVKCHFCNQPMFYAGDHRFEPEIHVSIRSTGGDPEFPDFSFFSHVRCWNERYNIHVT